LVATVFGAPEPNPKAKANPGIVAAAYYTAPVVAAPAALSAPIAYSSPYAAPLTYSAGYVASPSVYASGYSPYSASFVVV
jgi:hypothetical protein